MLTDTVSRHYGKKTTLDVLPVLRIFMTFASSLLMTLPALPAEARQGVPPLEEALPAVVQIAVHMTVSIDGHQDLLYLPLGSGTIVSSTGLILTSAHVVDPQVRRSALDKLQDSGEIAVETATDDLLILGSWEPVPAQPLFLGTLVAADEILDLAVLQIVANADGSPLQQERFPWLAIGSSDDVRFGDPIDILGYPGAGGSVITYTSGVVSGFGFDPSGITREWINTDAILSGGSSGGAALGSDGRLVGVVTQGSELDCRPGDTNRDGQITGADVGCIPVGGSIGQLRPSLLALDLLASAGYEACVQGLERNGITYLSCGRDRELLRVELPNPSICSTGPLYSPGTVLETGPGNITGILTMPETNEVSFVPPKSRLRVTGSFVESGACDVWPVEVVSVPAMPTWIYVSDEGNEQRRVLRNQIAEPGMKGFLDERVFSSTSTDEEDGVCDEVRIVPSWLSGEPKVPVTLRLHPPICDLFLGSAQP